MAYTPQSVNVLAQKFFKEYQERCRANPEGVKEELQHWSSGDGVILDMPLEKQAEFVDYVTNKICDLGPEAAEQFAEYTSPFYNESTAGAYASENNACTVGNYAKLILTMTNPELKEKHLGFHNRRIEFAKKKRSECVVF